MIVQMAIQELYNQLIRCCVPCRSAKEVSMTRKVALYQHIFSYSSVKTVVHWFQVLDCYCLYRLLRTEVTYHRSTIVETDLIVAPT